MPTNGLRSSSAAASAVGGWMTTGAGAVPGREDRRPRAGVAVGVARGGGESVRRRLPLLGGPAAGGGRRPAGLGRGVAGGGRLGDGGMTGGAGGRRWRGRGHEDDADDP